MPAQLSVARAAAPPPPPSGVQTYYEHNFKKQAVKILPGEFQVVRQDLMLVTVLGSCVAACIRDSRAGLGGMNHFMLPESGDRRNPLSESARYGAYAMEVLVNELLKQGASRDRLEAKVFGGGAIIAGMKQTNVGERNAAFVLDFLRQERIPIAAQDLLDTCARKVFYFPETGKAMVKRLRSLPNDTIMRREHDYRRQLSGGRLGGDVELFA